MNKLLSKLLYGLAIFCFLLCFSFSFGENELVFLAESHPMLVIYLGLFSFFVALLGIAFSRISEHQP